jgi:hypothetical protein
MASSTEAVSTPAIADHPVRVALLLGALGVVFGDIGTSPIYAFRESLKAAGGASEAAVFGVLSLVFWAIVLVVAIKYVVFVMRADNEGEGGTMALLSLALPVAGALWTGLLIVGLAGASLFFGDAMITPAISVLSAVEGLGIASPTVTPYVVPIAAVVLVCLFSIQSRGSGAVGFLFGPVMALWFATLAVAGLVQLVRYPRVLLALSPNYALAYVGHVGAGITFAVLGSVFLALTGGEALYADMGHFGRSAIRVSWFAFVLPALLLVYLGQGALVLADPASADNPFFLLFPNWLLMPAVLLTTAATVIASQAVLSGFCSCSASHSAGRHSASRSAPDLRGVGWPSVCSSNQLATGRPRSRARLWVSLLRRARQRLWNCGGRRHAGYNAAGHDGGLWSVALACGPGVPCRWIVLSTRSYFRLSQCSQNSRRRLVSATRRSCCAHSYARLAERSARRLRAARRVRH